MRLGDYRTRSGAKSVERTGPRIRTSRTRARSCANRIRLDDRPYDQRPVDGTRGSGNARLFDFVQGAHERAQRVILRARRLFDASGGVEHLLVAARLAAVAGVELVDHVRDVLDGLRDLPPAARLLLARTLDVLRYRAHLLGALHDELRASRLLGGRGRDLLNGFRDAADGVGDLLAALGLLDGGARDGPHHVRALLRAFEDLLQR